MMTDPASPGADILGGTLVDMVRSRARADPDGVPYMFAADGETWKASLTYRELDEAARAVARHLLEFGRPGDRVLLLYSPGLDFAVGFWACLYAGLIAIPVAPPRLRRAEDGAARLRAISTNSGAKLLLTTESMRRQLAAELGTFGGFEDLVLVATDEVDSSAARSWVTPEITRDSIAYLQYSSGSTGMPKGVALPHSSVLANAAVIGRAAQLRRGDSGVVWLPTFHDMGLLAAIILPVAHAFTVHQMPPLSFVRRPLDWLRAMSETRGTMSVAPNFAYELCVRRINPEQAEKLDLSSWHLALCGSEPIRAAALQSFAERFAVAGFSADAFFPTYGLAEATLMVSGGPFGGGLTKTRVDAEALSRGLAEPVSGTGLGHELVASGALVDELPLVVADPDTREPLPSGRVGELMVRGDSVAAGYWNSTEHTAETFDVEVPGLGRGFLRTGDLGFVHGNQLYVTGRCKDLIIVDGNNHYPHDIEGVAGAVHPAVRPGACAAFQRVDPSSSALVLVVEIDRAFRVIGDDAVGTDPASATVVAADLEVMLRAAVSREFALRLDEVVLVKQGTIPLTTSGKIERFAVAGLHRTGQLDTHRIAVDVVHS